MYMYVLFLNKNNMFSFFATRYDSWIGISVQFVTIFFLFLTNHYSYTFWDIKKERTFIYVPLCGRCVDVASEVVDMSSDCVVVRDEAIAALDVSVVSSVDSSLGISVVWGVDLVVVVGGGVCGGAAVIVEVDRVVVKIVVVSFPIIYNIIYILILLL